MARYDENEWPEYVSVLKRRHNAEREAVRLRKKGLALSPVTVEGRKIASTFWGTAWCDNLESYRDYANRLERGRSYVRNGSVIDLGIGPHQVTAMVSGSSIYTVKITIQEVRRAQWKSICADCAGGIDSLLELLRGRFSKAVMERICRQGTGLFPKPADIAFSCSCPDHASMCKHVAAALYGVGTRLDAKPELLFRLRAVDENDLVANIGEILPISRHVPAAGKVLRADDMAALFGLDMGDAADPATTIATPSEKPPATIRQKDKPGSKLAAARPAAPKPAPEKKAMRAATAPAGKAVPQPVEWWKPAASKPPVQRRKSTRDSAPASPGRKVGSSS